jgi:glycerol-3-phosphate acyltransferase PlsX
MNRPRIVVDGMGGDGGPAVAVPAAEALVGAADILVVGREEDLRAHASAHSRLRFVHAAEVLGPDDSLSSVLRQRPDASVRRALEFAAAGQADAVVSGCDTAQLMALARHVLGMVPGLRRPAIAKVMRGVAGRFWMLDLGANLECDESALEDFARMGSVAARALGGIDAPRVALLNIGTEANKGPALLGRAAQRLEHAPDLRYVGFVEGNRLFDDLADVVVCDGFAGNIALKSVEGAASMATFLLRRAVTRLRPLQRLGLWLMRNAVADLAEEIDPRRYNGASLFGLDGVVVKSHGSADRTGFEAAIEEAIEQARSDMPGLLRRAFHDDRSAPRREEEKA